MATKCNHSLVHLHIERTLMPRPLIAIVAAIVWVAGACSDSQTAPTTATEVGTYQLVRINGTALPAPFPAAGTGVTATSGTLVLSGTNQWTAEVAVLVVSGSVSIPSNQIMTGTYTRSRDTVFLRDARDGTTVPATLVGPTLSIRDGVTSYEFDRR
jgi:hypothetical protein